MKVICPKCGNEFEGNFCPNCGMPINSATPIQPVAQAPSQKKKKGCLTAVVIVIGIIAVIAIIATVSGGSPSATSSGAKSDSSVQATAQANSWDDKFDVKDLSISGTGANAKITGSIINKTDKQYKYLQVEINLYDKSGAQLGSTLANVNNLEAKATWKFEAYALKDGVASIKVKDVIGF